MVTVLDRSGVVKARPRHPEKAHRPDAPVLKKPDWIRVKAPVSRGYAQTQAIVRANGLHTVCEEAGCPNIGECWEKKHATFMIMGDTCTRACAFCNVKTGLPGPLDAAEPEGQIDKALLQRHHGLRHIDDVVGDRARRARWPPAREGSSRSAVPAPMGATGRSSCLVARIRHVPLSKIAWLTTVGVCLVTAVLMFVAGYNGYAGVAIAVGASAAINLR